MASAQQFLGVLVIGGTLFLPAFAAEPPTLQVGDPAPELLGVDTEGREVLLSSFPDRVVVLAFFATWCTPTIRELPMLDSLQRLGASKGVQVIAINFREDSHIFRNLVRRNPNYQLAFSSDLRGSVGNSYGVRKIPYTVVIGRDGKVSFAYLGYEKDSAIDAIIPEVNAALNANATPAVATETAPITLSSQ